MTSTRATLAVIVVALWIGGLAMMHRRNANVSEAQQIAQVAMRLQPQTYYYTIERDGEQIGAASSALDTTANSLVSEEYFVGDYPSAKSFERTSARWQTRLTRGFRLNDLSIDIARPTRPFSIKASIQEDTLLYIGDEEEGWSSPRSLHVHSPAVYAVARAGSLHVGRSAHDWADAETICVRSHHASSDSTRASDKSGVTVHGGGQRFD